MGKSEIAHLSEYCRCGAKLQGHAKGRSGTVTVEKLRDAFWAVHVGEEHGLTDGATCRRNRSRAEGRILVGE